jgi:hypothetical protein
MRVVTMALMDCLYYLLAIGAFVSALMSSNKPELAYFSAFALIMMFILLFWSIPLKLNWSSNLYAHLFYRFVIFLGFMFVIYAICYYQVGFKRADGTKPTFAEAIYFSITSFTTLQYGEFIPEKASRPLVCVESLMGLVAFVPVFASFAWIYCQKRLRDKSMEQKKIPKDFTLQHDPVAGGWREVENDRTKAEQLERNKSIQAVPCARCGAIHPKIEKFYDIIGRTTPLAHYVVHCKCGNITKPSTTAFLAVWRWKWQNVFTLKRRKEPSNKNTN